MLDLLHEPLPLLLLQTAVVVAVSRALNVVARRIDQPMVIAEVVAGIVLGPSLLGWLAPGLSSALFPPASLPALTIVSQIGLVLFMFLVGLELDPALLRGRAHASVLISHTSIILPFALGCAISPWLFPTLAPPGVPFAAFTLFLGAAMSITAFPVLARILAERRLLRTRVGAITIACAAVDDVTAWCILAFVVAVGRATGLETAFVTTGLALAYILLLLIVVRPLLARYGARVANREGLTQGVVAVVLLGLLVSSTVTEWIGVHALFGAFLFGAVLPKQGGLAHALAEKIEDLVLVLFLPLFFATSGLRTQIGLLDDPSDWLTCLAIVVVACVGKFGGSAVAARITGVGWREASTIGVLMNTRGLMELIVLNLGLDLGVISQELFTMMVIMALVTTFATTPIVKRLQPPDETARDALAAAPTPAALPAVPAFTVLMCVADDRSGPAMVSLASALGDPDATRNRYFALRLIPPTDRRSYYLGDVVPAAGAPEAPRALEPLLERATVAGIDVRPLSFVSNRVAEDICRVAEVKAADLLLLGWHKPVLGRTVLGGTVHDVLRLVRSDVGVLVDRGLGTAIRRVLVPYQGTAHDRAALGLARRLAARGSVEVTVLHVVRPGRAAGDARLGAQAEAERTFGTADTARVRLAVVEHSDPPQAVLDESRRGYDLTLIGLGPEWGLEGRPVGLRSEVLVQRCPVSLLLVRARPGSP